MSVSLLITIIIYSCTQPKDFQLFQKSLNCIKVSLEQKNRMRKITAILLLVCFSINSLAGVVDNFIVCFHNDSVHIDFSSFHCCAQKSDFDNSASKILSSHKASTCVDLLIEPQDLPKIISKSLKLSGPQICAYYNISYAISKLPLPHKNTYSSQYLQNRNGLTIKPICVPLII